MVEVNNLTKIAISRSFLRGVAKKVLMGENRKEETLSIAVVDKKEMEELNSRYRNKQEPTDVLSFDLSCEFLESKKVMGLGEVVICPEKIRENAEKFNIDFKKELTKVLIHGILHLLGYDHEKSEADAKKMREREEHYLVNF
jgi:probable rRNA maturation factor